MKYLETYSGYELWDNRTPEVSTRYPVSLTKGHRKLGSYRTLWEARAEVDRRVLAEERQRNRIELCPTCGKPMEQRDDDGLPDGWLYFYCDGCLCGVPVKE